MMQHHLDTGLDTFGTESAIVTLVALCVRPRPTRP